MKEPMGREPDDKTYNEAQVSVASLDEVRSLPPGVERILVHSLDDDKAGALARHSGLRVLYQDGNARITDLGLAALADLRELEMLDLEWAKLITDAGLAHLHRLRNLKWIDLSFCKLVTAAGVAALQRALPGCEVEGWPEADTRKNG